MTYATEEKVTCIKTFEMCAYKKYYNPEGRGFDSRWCHW